MTIRSLLFALLLWPVSPALAEPIAVPPADFVDLALLAPTIAVEMRYFGEFNFVGRPVRGYDAPRCLLTQPAATALAQVQARLEPFGLGLKVFDCYRPQRAVDHFVEWAQDLDDTRYQAVFYPTVPKALLFQEGYIADHSSHSRGSTVDLTLIPLPPPSQSALAEQRPPCTAAASSRPWENGLDMGTAFDCFDPRSWTASLAVAPQARANRLLLKQVMEAEGFINYPNEWWHFTLAAEPFPEQRFDFPVSR